jgi:hypothetical protein
MIPARLEQATNARHVPTAVWIGTPITVRRGSIMNPPPTPKRPEKNPVVPPTIRLSASSRVINVLTPGCVESRSPLHTPLGVFARIMSQDLPGKICSLARVPALPGDRAGALRDGKPATCPLGKVWTR